MFTGSGTAAVYTLTAAGLALLDDASASAQRTTLGLGDMSTQSASGVAITGGTITGITDLAVADGGTGSGTAAGARSNLSAASTTQTELISGVFLAPEATTYKLVVKIPYGGTITEVTTISSAGTATATFKINTTALGGTANSVSSVEQSQAHASSNTFVAGDDIQVTFSSVSADCENVSFTIKFTRTLD